MNELIRKAETLINNQTGPGTHCVLAMRALDGYPTVSTITASKAKGIEEIYFCTGLGGTKSKRSELDNRASVCFNSEDHNITLVGIINIITELKIKEEMWYSGLINHFTGPDDPNYCVLQFKTERYNLLVNWQKLRGQI